MLQFASIDVNYYYVTVSFYFTQSCCTDLPCVEDNNASVYRSVKKVTFFTPLCNKMFFLLYLPFFPFPFPGFLESSVNMLGHTDGHRELNFREIPT